MTASRSTKFGISALLVALVIAVYWPAITFGYVLFDDPQYVTNNNWAQRGLTFDGARWAFTTLDAANWHPLTWLSLMLDTTLFRNNATGHHVMNIALHVLNVLLLLNVLQAMTGAFWRSVLVAALLAVHPLHVESVAWISERKDVLSMLFWLLAMRAYVGYVRAPGVPRYLLIMAMMALGLMAKPMVVTLPCALLLLDYWPLKRIDFAPTTVTMWRRAVMLLLEKLPLLALAAGSGAVTVYAQQNIGELTEGHWLTISERLQIVAMGYASYPLKMFWPANLAALYPNLLYIGRAQWPASQVQFAGAAVLAVTVLAIALIRRVPYFAVAWLWYLVTMIPVIGFVHIGRHTMADRYAYIPFIGLYVILAWGAGDLLQRLRWLREPIAGGALAAAAVLTLAVVAHRQVYMWRDTQTLFERTIAATRDNWLMHNNLAAVYEQQGQMNRALEHVQRAAEICNDCGWVQRHLGETLAHAERWSESADAFRWAVALDPRDGLSHLNLATVLVQMRSYTEALDHFASALAIDPDSGETHKSMAIALSVIGNRQQAIGHMQEAIRLKPEMAAQWEPLLQMMMRSASPAESTAAPQP